MAGMVYSETKLWLELIHYDPSKKMRGNVREKGILQVLLPMEVLVQSCAGMWHLSIHTPDGAPLHPGLLGATRDLFHILGWDWTGLVPCSFWSLAFRLAGSSHVASSSAVAQSLALLYTCCISFLSPRETSIQDTATKNTYHYIIANQIMKKSRVELDEWMLSLSIPKCLFSPYICWCDLQSILVTKHKLSPASFASCLKSFPKGRNCILTGKIQVKLPCSMGSWYWDAHPQSLSNTR